MSDFDLDDVTTDIHYVKDEMTQDALRSLLKLILKLEERINE